MPRDATKHASHHARLWALLASCRCANRTALTLLAGLPLCMILYACGTGGTGDHGESGKTQIASMTPGEGEDSARFAELSIPAGRGVLAFQAAREVLREEGFTLDRIDAPLGVLTTFPRATEGLARPWVPRTDGLVEDVIQNQRRLVTVMLRPAGAPEAAFAADDTSFDLTRSDGPFTLRVVAVVERVTRPTRRLSPDGVRLLAPATDPTLDRQGIAGGYRVAIRTDATTQRRLVRLIESALSQEPVAPFADGAVQGAVSR